MRNLTCRRMILTVSSLLVLASGCEDLKRLIGETKTVYVTPTVLNLRGGPTTGAPVLLRLQRGDELAVLEARDPWLKVRTTGETEGWVHGGYVGSPADVKAKYDADLGAAHTRRVRRPSRESSAPAVQPAHDPGKLNLAMEDLLRGFPDDLPVDDLDPIEGTKRAMSATAAGQVVMEFWGEDTNLDRASMMVTVLDIPGEELERNAEMALRFVRNALPALNRDRAWMVNRLRELSSKDEGEGELKTSSRMVTFTFLKPLGAVRIGVEAAG